jgi:hypothetical protein
MIAQKERMVAMTALKKYMVAMIVNIKNIMTIIPDIIGEGGSITKNHIIKRLPPPGRVMRIILKKHIMMVVQK